MLTRNSPPLLSVQCQGLNYSRSSAMSHKNTSASNEEEQKEKFPNTRISHFNSQLFTLAQSCWPEPAPCSCPSSKPGAAALTGRGCRQCELQQEGCAPQQHPRARKGGLPQQSLHPPWTVAGQFSGLVSTALWGVGDHLLP